jgi:hypothetical protein
MNMQAGILELGDAVGTSPAGAGAMFSTTSSKIAVFIVILIIGWFLASLVEKGAATLLQRIKVKDLILRSRISHFAGKLGIKSESVGIIVLIVLIAAVNTLGLSAVLDTANQLSLWLPDPVIALGVLIIGGLGAGALSKLVRGAASHAELRDPDLSATITNIAIRAFATVIAINQIGIATTLVDTLLMAAVGAGALALGMAFGLSGYDAAVAIVRTWYEKGRQAIPRVKVAAQEVKGQVPQPTRQTVHPRV